MGYVFCLVILQNGNRRKLKLATGAYAELLEKLTGIVDVDHENTLIQMFDTDLDDFVDLVPEDKIPNKAKLRVISRSASTVCNAAVATGGQNVAPTCPRNLCAIKPASANEHGEVSLKPEIQEAGSDAMETSEPVIIIEIPRETVTRSDAAVQTMAVGGNGKTGTMAANVTRIQDALCAMQPYSIVNDMQTDDAAISPAAAQDKQDYLKFMLPPSFGVWYDAFLQSKRPITRKVRTHIISVLFKACYRTTLYPTSRLYQKVLDSLVAKYPHVIEGKYNRRKWSIALRSRFKNARKNLVVAAAAVKVQRTCGIERLLADTDDEHAYAHTQLALASQKTSLSSSGDLSNCEDKSVHEEELGEFKSTTAHDAEAKNFSNMEAVPSDSVELCLVSEPTECVKKSEHLKDEESMDCPDYSDAVLEEFTVSDLLGMCTDEKASEALMAQQESRVSLDERENCDKPVEEVSPQEVEPSSKPEQQVDAPLDELDCEVVAQSSKPAQRAEGPLHEHDHMVPVPSSKLEQQAEAPLDEPDHVVLAPGLKPTEQAEVPLHEPDRVVLVPNSNLMKQAERPLQEHDHTVLVPSSKREQQVEAPLEEPDLVGFELPSFGIFDELLRMQVPVSHTMQWHIVFSLFNALSKKTMHPKKEQIREVVAILLQKYPHLSKIKRKTGKEFWMNALTKKFSQHRTILADVTMKPCKPQSLDHDKGSQRFFRPVCIDEQPLEDKDNACHQGESEVSAAADCMDDHKRELVAMERHNIIREMSVEEIISAFPVFREESSLLGEFRVLWNTDIVDCFEKGIKKLFLVLMNCGTSEEIQAISEPDNDILLVVLNSIARRCGEELDSILVKGNALPTPCLVTSDYKNIDMFVNGSRLFAASSLLGGLCALFASFWLLQLEYSQCGQGIMTFLEHAFLDFNYTTPQGKCKRFINLYRRVTAVDSRR